jgi:hypothetical protein
MLTTTASIAAGSSDAAAGSTKNPVPSTSTSSSSTSKPKPKPKPSTTRKQQSKNTHNSSSVPSKPETASGCGKNSASLSSTVNSSKPKSITTMNYKGHSTLPQRAVETKTSSKLTKPPLIPPSLSLVTKEKQQQHVQNIKNEHKKGTSNASTKLAIDTNVSEVTVPTASNSHPSPNGHILTSAFDLSFLSPSIDSGKESLLTTALTPTIATAAEQISPISTSTSPQDQADLGFLFNQEQLLSLLAKGQGFLSGQTENLNAGDRGINTKKRKMEEVANVVVDISGTSEEVRKRHLVSS